MVGDVMRLYDLVSRLRARSFVVHLGLDGAAEKRVAIQELWPQTVLLPKAVVVDSISRDVLLVLLQVLEQGFGDIDVLVVLDDLTDHPTELKIHTETVIKEVGFIVLLLIVIALVELLRLHDVLHLVTKVLAFEEVRLIGFHLLL